MNIRKVKIEDIEELVKIRIAYLKEDYLGLSEDHLISLNIQLPNYFTEHIGKDFIAYIAEENGAIISSVFLVICEKPANPGFITGKTGTFLNVYTKPEFRKQGLAGQLMKLAIEEAKALDLSYLDLSATQAGYPLYKKLGFEETKSHCVSMKYVL